MSVVSAPPSLPPKPATADDMPQHHWPGVWFWIWLAFALLMILILKVPVLQENVWGLVFPPDNAIANLITQALIVVTYVAYTFWLLAFSTHPWGVRVIPVAVVGVLLVIFKPGRPTGEMWIPWEPRWTVAADESLPVPPAAVQPDLAAKSGPESSPEPSQREPPRPAVALTPVSIGPTDFPEFLGAGRQANVTSVKLARNWEVKPPREIARWKVGAGWAGFAVVGDRAVTLEQRGPVELVTCYNWRSGEMLWSVGANARHDNAMGGLGPRSVPTITADGQVFALGATGWLYALRFTDGKEMWRRQILYEAGLDRPKSEEVVMWGRSASPLVVDDLVVVPLGGPKHKPVSLVAYDRMTSQERWRSGNRQVSYASPILTTVAGQRQIISVNENNVSAHEPTRGQLLWQVDFDGNSTAAANCSQPWILPGDRLLLSKGYGIGARCFEIQRQPAREKAGRDKWTVEPVWGGEGRAVLKTKFTNLVLHQGHAYGLDDGTLQCVDLETGEMKWKAGRYGQGQILGANGVILVQSENGPVFLVEANSDEHIALGRLDALSSQTWNNPALAGRYLIVRNAEEAASYELPVEE